MCCLCIQVNFIFSVWRSIERNTYFFCIFFCCGCCYSFASICGVHFLCECKTRTHILKMECQQIRFGTKWIDLQLSSYADKLTICSTQASIVKWILKIVFFFAVHGSHTHIYTIFWWQKDRNMHVWSRIDECARTHLVGVDTGDGIICIFIVIETNIKLLCNWIYAYDIKTMNHLSVPNEFAQMDLYCAQWHSNPLFVWQKKRKNSKAEFAETHSNDANRCYHRQTGTNMQKWCKKKRVKEK